MSIQFPDKVEITPITVIAGYGAETEGASFISKAFVEFDSKIRYGANGQPIEPNIFIGLPKDITIKEGYYIKVTELHGATPNDHEAERRKVRRASRVGGFTISHIEVIV